MQTETSAIIEVISLGVTPYEKALNLQGELHARVRDAGHPGFLLLLEHSPVLTLGKNASNQYLKGSQEAIRADIYRSDRGGEVTAHMPGQLVVYPILPIQRWKLSPRSYVDKLLQTVVETLREFLIEAHTDEQYPGVWVNEKKICAIGVRIKERVSLHGIALNIDNDLSLFDAIIPCGISDRGVCSMRSLRKDGIHPTRPKVEEVYVRHFLKVFGVPEV